MLSKVSLDTGHQPVIPREGDLYKVIRIHGRTFEIRYGFYEERDRHSRYAEPMEIYPDFLKDPQYTDEGTPFATAVQRPCPYFTGKADENSVCEECSYYQHGEELLGLCICPMNRRSPDAPKMTARRV